MTRTITAALLIFTILAPGFAWSQDALEDKALSNTNGAGRMSKDRQVELAEKRLEKMK